MTQSIRNPFLLILRSFLGSVMVYDMVNNKFLMNAYPAQIFHRANKFFDYFQENTHKYKVVLLVEHY